LLSLGWLLPNHSLPWTSFHSDAWLAFVLSITGIVVLLMAKNSMNFYAMNLFSGAMLLIPVFQYFYGILAFFEQSLISVLYIAGFLFCQLIGQQWQKWRPLGVGNFLFSAIGIAAIASVGLQLYQWLGLTRENKMTDIWILALEGGRPYANLGQPNQLSTLLLWGLLACAWGTWRKHISNITAIFIAVFILLGLALTQSRSGMIGLCVLIFACWWWIPFKNKRGIRIVTGGLGIFYFFALWIIGPLSRFMLLDDASSVLDTSSAHLRLLAWQMLLDAIAQKPWQGYGWNGVMSAHLLVGDQHKDVGQLFAQSHNLFLDFFVWNGIPIGMALSVFFILWFGIAIRRTNQLPECLYILILAVVGVHSMLEFPLHYAYFLFPAGIVVGILNESHKIYLLSELGAVARGMLYCFYLTVLLVFGFVVRDYFYIEQASVDIRFQGANIKSAERASVPDVIILNKQRAQLEFFLIEPHAGASNAEIKKAEALAYSTPSYFNMMKLITLLALNNHIEKAEWWMRKVPYVLDADLRKSIDEYWSQIRNTYPTLKELNWVAN